MNRASEHIIDHPYEQFRRLRDAAVQGVAGWTLRPFPWSLHIKEAVAPPEKFAVRPLLLPDRRVVHLIGRRRWSY